MNQQERDIQGKLRNLKHAEETGHAARTCMYFGIARASFYRWKLLYKKEAEAGLTNKKTIPKNPTNRTPPAIVEKIQHLRGPITSGQFPLSGSRPPSCHQNL